VIEEASPLAMIAGEQANEWVFSVAPVTTVKNP
jgi:hypothetical protein